MSQARPNPQVSPSPPAEDGDSIDVDFDDADGPASSPTIETPTERISRPTPVTLEMSRAPPERISRPTPDTAEMPQEDSERISRPTPVTLEIPRERISSPAASQRDAFAGSGASPAAIAPPRDPLARSGSNLAAHDPLARSGSNLAARDPLSMSGPNVATLDEPAPGTVIVGRYQLQCIIGRGGMGAVWLARDLTLDIDVAMKLIRRDRAAPEARGRLLQEARAAARIGHPSIVRIFDFGESAEGDPFIVMELLHGESLSNILARRQRLAPLIAVGTLLPVASALVAAHSKGIVHRDLKPDNILLVNNEAGALVPKLLDFGIARLLDSDPERRFTLAGDVLGSPDYMSPEQARGEVDVGAPTDIWAFSVLFYEAITGRRPFQAGNYNALIMAIITNEATPTTELAAGDAELWAILQRGLTKDISQRWPSMRDLGAALASWALERGLQDDAAGTSLASHWLSGARRRTFSLHPFSAINQGVQGVAPPDAITQPQPQGDQHAALAAVDTLTRPPFVSNRKPWIALVLVLVAVGIALLVFLSSAPTESTAEQPAQASAPVPTAKPTPSPTTAPAAPSSTAPASSPRSVTHSPPPVTRDAPAPPPTAKPIPRSAPPAPKDIKF